MTELINSLKIFASNGSDAAKSHLRNVPLMTLGRADSCSESGFNQWRDAMRMVARLPGGLPPEFRIRLWENLADRYLQKRGLDWGVVVAKCRASENCNSRDEDIADQIEKDLHRTGCTGFSGAKQAVLKRVLVAYARWNPAVGYCQGFNMIGAMLLQMTIGDERLTLKIFVFLIEGVLPQGYFSQGLRGLAVDMAVFREILKLRKPTLNAHLAQLQKGDDNPPLTDVFTMHWFLTLFIHCLPTPSVLRIWDLVLLEGSEVLLRTALVLWAAIETRILCVSSADEFYSVMGVVTREMLEFGLMDPNSLVKCIVSVGQFPFPGLDDLRQKHRAIISQDTPHKSFFLAKRELDNLKRHYSAIRHKQRATTVILKGLEARTMTTAASKFSKPKPRRTNSGGKSVILHNNNHNNKNNLPSNRQQNNRNNGFPHPHSTTAGNQNNHQITTHSQNNKQVTVPWDVSTKKPKNFRKRATSSSSYTSSSSSSTELCDSMSDDDENKAESDSVWTDTETRDDAPSKNKNSNSTNTQEMKKEPIKSETLDSPLKVKITNEESKVTSVPTKTENETIAASPAILKIPTISIPDETEPNIPEKSDREKSDGEKSPKISVSSTSPSADPEEDDDDDSLDNIGNSKAGDLDGRYIDANDSQHFLEEMSRLGKSDSFYENLSHRICQLQFQNLRILTTCNTIPDPVILPNMEFSPLPSPMSPFPPRSPTPSSILSRGNLNIPMHSRLILSPSLNHLSLSTSPRGSCSSLTSQPGSPLVRSPVVSSPGPEFPGNSSRHSSRRTSRSSISSTENENKCMAESPAVSIELPVVPIAIQESITSLTSQEISAPSCSDTEVLVILPEASISVTDSSETNVEIPLNSGQEIPPESPRTDEHDEIASTEKKEETRIILTDSSPMNPKDFDLSLPILSPSTITSQQSLLLAESVSGSGTDDGSLAKFDLPASSEDLRGEIVADAVAEADEDPNNQQQQQTSEDISAVIRENLAILQRLKLKPAYEDDYEDTSSTSSVTEFSDEDLDGGAVAATVDLEVSSSSTNVPSRPPSVTITRRRPLSRCNSSGSGGSTSGGRPSSLTRSNSSVCSNCSRSSSIANQKKNQTSSKPKKIFNPFPTARKARVRTTKFGLYN